jgi:Ni/Fe-hydrogenase subunit HybB-like protein
MRTSNTHARKFSWTVVKVLMALIFASMIGGISIAPAFARHRHEGYRVYAPPAVVYTPDEYVSPGIDLAFPIEIGGYGGGHGGRR